MSDAQTSLRYLVLFYAWVFSCKISWLLCLETRFKEEPVVRRKWKQNGGICERIRAMGAYGTWWCCGISLGHLGEVSEVLTHLWSLTFKIGPKDNSVGSISLESWGQSWVRSFWYTFPVWACEGMWLGTVSMDLLSVSYVWRTSLSSVMK